jgi:hypothetical protein
LAGERARDAHHDDSADDESDCILLLEERSHG